MKMDPKFLHPKPPANARIRRIEFTTTNPPLIEFKNYVAAVIDNALTEAECKELLRLAEASTADASDRTATPTWERAMINMGNGKQALAVDSRHCGRIIFDTPALADKLLARLMPFLRELDITELDNRPFATGLAGRGKKYRLTRLNDRLRFLKYVGGEYFRPHWDGQYVTADKRERSFFTVHLYLNGDGEQDLRELVREEKRAEEQQGRGQGEINPDPEGPLLGGATSFLAGLGSKAQPVRIFPRTGSVLVFQHYGLFHGGDPVFRGTKYTVRTDAMYEEVRQE